MTSTQSRLTGIELIRFASALAILVFHYQHFSYIGGSAVGLVTERQPYYSVLKFAYEQGKYAVQVFWCVSGFIFFHKYADRISNRSVSGPEFFWLRLSRLYPLHFATLILVAFLQILYSAHPPYFVFQNNDAPHFVAQLFMASDWLPTGASFNGPIWSVSLEVLVYGCFFFTARYIPRAFFVSAAIVALAVIIQISGVSTQSFWACVMCFYLGGLTQLVYAHSNATLRTARLLTIAAIAVVISVVLAGRFVHLKTGYYLTALMPSAIVLAVAHVSNRRLVNSALTTLGNMTYASYLIHFPLQLSTVLVFRMLHLAIPFYSPAFFLAFIVTTLVLSYCIYNKFELPAQNYLRLHCMPSGAWRPRVAGIADTETSHHRLRP